MIIISENQTGIALMNNTSYRVTISDNQTGIALMNNTSLGGTTVMGVSRTIQSSEILAHAATLASRGHVPPNHHSCQNVPIKTPPPRERDNF